MNRNKNIYKGLKYPAFARENDEEIDRQLAEIRADEDRETEEKES